MKKAGTISLVIITLLFVICIVGIFLGRRTFTLLTQHSDSENSTTSVTTKTTKQIVISDGKLNINKASADELIMLPGIGEVLAERIIQYRSEHGPFASIDELINVKGIGEARLEAIEDYITIGE